MLNAKEALRFQLDQFNSIADSLSGIAVTMNLIARLDYNTVEPCEYQRALKTLESLALNEEKELRGHIAFIKNKFQLGGTNE